MLKRTKLDDVIERIWKISNNSPLDIDGKNEFTRIVDELVEARDEEKRYIKPVKVEIEEQLTRCYFNDGSVTTAKPDGKDKYDPYFGLAIAVAKGVYGSYSNLIIEVKQAITNKINANNIQRVEWSTVSDLSNSDYVPGYYIAMEEDYDGRYPWVALHGTGYRMTRTEEEARVWLINRGANA